MRISLPGFGQPQTACAPTPRPWQTGCSKSSALIVATTLLSRLTQSEPKPVAIQSGPPPPLSETIDAASLVRDTWAASARGGATASDGGSASGDDVVDSPSLAGVSTAGAAPSSPDEHE